MRATAFEFKHRFWFIGLIYWIGFSLYGFDRVNFGVAVLRLFAPSVDPESALGNNWLRFIFGLGAILVFLAALLRTWATAHLRTEVVHDSGLHSESLVADGPFRFVRNPLYLAGVPLSVGMGMMASRLG